MRKIDISLWLNVCPRTELIKQKNFLEFLIGVNYLSKYNLCSKCEVLEMNISTNATSHSPSKSICAFLIFEDERFQLR